MAGAANGTTESPERYLRHGKSVIRSKLEAQDLENDVEAIFVYSPKPLTNATTNAHNIGVLPRLRESGHGLN